MIADPVVDETSAKLGEGRHKRRRKISTSKKEDVKRKRKKRKHEKDNSKKKMKEKKNKLKKKMEKMKKKKREKYNQAFKSLSEKVQMKIKTLIQRYLKKKEISKTANGTLYKFACHKIGAIVDMKTWDLGSSNKKLMKFIDDNRTRLIYILKEIQWNESNNLVNIN